MRYWEIDFLRGVAVVLMIAYHAIFGFYFPDVPFRWLAFLASSTFIIISGMSLSISYSKGGGIAKFLKRGAKLAVLACLVTAASFIFLESGYILFGVLHFFALSSVLVYPFMKYAKSDAVLFVGVGAILIGIALMSVRIDVGYLFWMGLVEEGFTTFDFFPIFPWLGVMLIGAHIGSNLYPNGKRMFGLNWNGNKFTSIFQFLGRYSLLIYFIHIPLLLAALYLSGADWVLPMFQ